MEHQSRSEKELCGIFVGQNRNASHLVGSARQELNGHPGLLHGGFTSAILDDFTGLATWRIQGCRMVDGPLNRRGGLGHSLLLGRFCGGPHDQSVCWFSLRMEKDAQESPAFALPAFSSAEFSDSEFASEREPERAWHGTDCRTLAKMPRSSRRIWI